MVRRLGRKQGMDGIDSESIFHPTYFYFTENASSISILYLTSTFLYDATGRERAVVGRRRWRMGEGEIFALNAHNTHLIKIIHHVLQAGKKKKGYKAAERPFFTFNFRDSGVSGVETKHLYQPALIAEPTKPQYLNLEEKKDGPALEVWVERIDVSFWMGEKLHPILARLRKRRRKETFGICLAPRFVEFAWPEVAFNEIITSTSKARYLGTRWRGLFLELAQSRRLPNKKFMILPCLCWVDYFFHVFHKLPVFLLDWNWCLPPGWLRPMDLGPSSWTWYWRWSWCSCTQGADGMNQWGVIPFQP